jgi:hypothetical protein
MGDGEATETANKKYYSSVLARNEEIVGALIYRAGLSDRQKQSGTATKNDDQTSSFVTCFSFHKKQRINSIIFGLWVPVLNNGLAYKTTLRKRVTQNDNKKACIVTDIHLS